MASFFWVGGTGTWDNASTAHWSASSGGGAGAGPPTSADDAIVDANSGTGTLTLASTAAALTFTQSGVNNINVIRFTDGMTFHTSRWRVAGPGGASTKFGWTPAASTAFFSTPDSVASSITGDIDLQIRTDAQTNSGILLEKWTGGTKLTFQVTSVVDGTNIRLNYSIDGTTVLQSGFAQDPLHGTDHWLRVTRVAASGVVQMFSSATQGSWGSPFLNQTLTSGNLFDSDAPVRVGASETGRFYQAQMYNGIAGTLAVDLNAADYSTGTTWTSSTTGEVWTINGAALVSATDKIALCGTGTAGWNIVMDATGTPASDYISINHSTATGTWFAGSHSINGGSNSGWSFTQVSGSFTDYKTGTQPGGYQFNDTSQFSPTTWLWDFGDGTTSSDQNPSHVFQPGGPYTITFTPSYGTMIATSTTDTTILILGGGGHAAEEGDSYSESRRVIIAGKPYTVRSKGEYFSLLRKYGKKGSVDAAQKQASQIIEKARETAREGLSQKEIQETAELLRLKIEKDSLIKKQQDLEFARSLEGIPMPVLKMIAELI